MKTKAGIDYSIASPSLCICHGEEFKLENCIFHYVTDDIRFDVSSPQFIRHDKPSGFKYQIDRFHQTGKIFARACNNYSEYDGFDVLLEDYAFGAKGRVFHIGENCGVLKLLLFGVNVDFDVLAVPSLKKFATDSGKADKAQMHEAFVKDTGLDLIEKFGVKHERIGPISDMVDAYWLCKYNWERLDA